MNLMGRMHFSEQRSVTINNKLIKILHEIMVVIVFKLHDVRILQGYGGISPHKKKSYFQCRLKCSSPDLTKRSKEKLLPYQIICMEYDITVQSITHLHHFTFFHQRLTLTFQFIKLTLGNTNSISIQGHSLTPNIYLLHTPGNPKTITL